MNSKILATIYVLFVFVHNCLSMDNRIMISNKPRRTYHFANFKANDCFLKQLKFNKKAYSSRCFNQFNELLINNIVSEYYEKIRLMSVSQNNDDQQRYAGGFLGRCMHYLRTCFSSSYYLECLAKSSNFDTYMFGKKVKELQYHLNNNDASALLNTCIGRDKKEYFNIAITKLKYKLNRDDVSVLLSKCIDENKKEYFNIAITELKYKLNRDEIFALLNTYMDENKKEYFNIAITEFKYSLNRDDVSVLLSKCIDENKKEYFNIAITKLYYSLNRDDVSVLLSKFIDENKKECFRVIICLFLQQLEQPDTQGNTIFHAVAQKSRASDVVKYATMFLWHNKEDRSAATSFLSFRKNKNCVFAALPKLVAIHIMRFLPKQRLYEVLSHKNNEGKTAYDILCDRSEKTNNPTDKNQFSVASTLFSPN